jgi:hypothetical protein
MGPDVEGFERIERVASGGSATVYRAFQPAFDRWVALKVIDRAPADEDVRAALADECRLVGRLTDHPNVVTVFDSGTTTTGEPYIAMAWFEGGSLADRTDGGRSLTVREVVATGVRLGGALESAHRVGMLHRDVKPANVVFNRFGEPALTDFGVGSLLDGGPGRSRGYTPAFAPPEVRSGDGDRPASDVYSLGLTLRAALGDTPAGEVPPELGELLDRMADEDPDRRPSVHEVIAALGAIEATHGWGPTIPVLLAPGRGANEPGGTADHAPTLPPPRPPVEPPRSPRVRTPILVAGFVAVVVALVVAVAAIRRDGGTGRAADPARTTTTTRFGQTSGTVLHPAGVADRSPELRAGLGDVGADAALLTGEHPLATDLTVGTYFSTSASFPEVEPLPGRAEWYFAKPGVRKAPCAPFRSGPLTMDGFAGGVAVANSAIVTIATYTFVDERSAEVFFGGRSLSLGPDDDECRGPQVGPRRVEHRDIPVDGMTVPVDQVNTWHWERPGPLGEVRAYGIVARRGPQLYEVRVGVRDQRTYEPAQLLALADAVIGAG